MFEVGAQIQGLSSSYVVLGEHANGGMSRTFRARSVSTDTEVLLKVTSFAGMRDWRAFERFEREVRTLSSLSHPRIPKSIELFAWDGTTALLPANFPNASTRETPVALVHVQELVSGRSLAAALAAGARFSAEELTVLYRELLQTLAYLHALLPPVLHRDLQPQNVILDPEGHPHLVDFGLSLAADAPTHSVSLGAPGYVAPEVVLGIAGPSADLYALAATILTAASHLAATEFPRDPKTARVLVHKAAPGLPPQLARTLERSLEMDVGKRAASAKDVLASLSKRTSLASRASFFKTRVRTVALGAAGLGLLVVLPLGLKMRAHCNKVAQEAALARAQPLEDELTAAMAASPASEAEPVPVPSTSSSRGSGVGIDWTGEVIGTMTDGPTLGTRCALTLMESPNAQERKCQLQLACGTSKNFIIDQAFGSEEREGACVVSQSADAVPDHFRYSLRATDRSEGGNTIFIDTDQRIVRVANVLDGVRSELRVRLDSNEPRAFSADLYLGPSTFAKAIQLRGIATTVEGSAPVGFGAPCTAAVHPRSSYRDNCGIEISCGGKTLYRKSQAVCAIDGDKGAFAGFDDFDVSLFDETPRASILTTKKHGRDTFTIELSDDTAEGHWSVSMEMNRDK